MKIAYDVKKRLIILIWCLAVSLFLWFFAIAIKPEFALSQFMNFCILLFGGGFAYHIVTELLACPYNESNSKQWGRVVKPLLVVYVGYIIIFGFVLLGKLLGDGYGWFIVFFGFIIGMLWCIYFFKKLEHPIRELLFSDKQI